MTRGTLRRAVGALTALGALASPVSAGTLVQCGPAVDTGDGTHRAGTVVLAAVSPRAFDTAALCAALPRLAPPEANLHGLVVEQGGHLLAEAYFEGRDHPGGSPFGRDRRFDPGEPHDLRSVTKSVTALLAGIAVAEGRLDTTRAVLDHFPELADLRGTPSAALTLDHLLDMNSGLQWDESGSYLRPGNDETRMRLSADPWRFVMARPLESPPGTRFNYHGGGTGLLGEAVSRAVGQPLEAYAQARLFDPLGIPVPAWRRGPGDRVTPWGGLQLRPRELARIGRLVLDGGRWQGRPVVSAAWITRLLAPGLPAGPGLHYRGGWWQGVVSLRGATWPYVAGFGNGGQRLYLVPALDLVVVVTAGRYNDAESWKAPLRVLYQVVARVVEPAAGPAATPAATPPASGP